MPFCSFDRNAGMYDSTPIENMFLLEYLPTAPEDFLRVYLYARMLCLHPELGDGMDELARALHMESDAVYDAMTYWERQGLVRRLTDRPPTYAILPVMQGVSGMSNSMESDYYEYRDFNANLQAIFGSELLQPKQYAMANDWINILGFTQDAVLKMVEEKYRRSRAKKPHGFFNKLNETAAQWAERGIRTVEDVERALESDGQVEKVAATVMKHLSMNRTATADELKLVSTWIHDWKLSQDEIIAACAETTKSRSPSLAYLNSILESHRTGEGDSFGLLKAVLKELGSNVPPTPEQMKWFTQMLQQGFEAETLRLAAAECARKRQHRFDDLSALCDEWGKMNLQMFIDADAYVQAMNQLRTEVRELLQICGASRAPQRGDVKYYESWMNVHSRDLIAYAAECARGMDKPMLYINKILSEWEKSGIKTVNEARAQHEGRSYAKPVASAPASNPALNYEQRSNDQTNYSSHVIDLSQFYDEESEQT